MSGSTHDRPKLTRNQTLVLDTLEAADGPLSAYTILDRLREEGLRAPLQVYRALDKLTALGLVHRVESLNAFISCGHPDGEGHGAVAFAICEDCGDVREFAREDLLRPLRDWAGQEGFHARATVIELRGLCENCAAA